MTDKKEIVLGGGCFWCIEAVYNRIDGVEVTSGYAGGSTKNPSYDEVVSGRTGHAEVVKVIYNPEIITLKTILDVFFQMHDPTTRNRQGNDIGTQYRSIILYTTPKDEKIIQARVIIAPKIAKLMKTVLPKLEYSK
ncbi:MAG: peptide-methionine (S)-S-oxide reductase MsrA [Asgard group archaeon]|nr:peptide-methionine (S)-S-oxide reductase MsrA [Asgard group archaeon]